MITTIMFPAFPIYEIGHKMYIRLLYYQGSHTMVMVIHLQWCLMLVTQFQ